MMGGIDKSRIITSIDIGTTKICVFIAKILDSQTIEIIGFGKAPSDGLAKGVVIDIGKTVHAISIAIKEAELMAGHNIEHVVIGISGGHIKSINSRGMISIKKGLVRIDDIENAINTASAVPLEHDYQILHVLPQYFMLNGRELVYDPIGMHGIRLEVEAHIILGAVSSVQNLITCCERSDVHIEDIILEQLASAEAVLTYDERMLGVGVLDIGGGTADLAIYHQGSIRHTMVLPVAGNHFTNDLAIGLQTKIDQAELIKKEFGIVHKNFLMQDQIITIESISGERNNTINHKDILRILYPRAYELLSIVHKEIIEKKLRGYLSSGLVLTGGGSLICGMQELAKEIFEFPVRIGKPNVTFDLPSTLKNPAYSTGYGMLLYTLKKLKKEGKSNQHLNHVTKVFERMKSWIIDMF